VVSVAHPNLYMKKRKKSTLAAPTTLRAVSEDDPKTIQVIIETPKGSRNKFGYDSKLGVFKLKKVLPQGMVFPYDFGFVPSTKAGDEDPADVLVLMDEPVPTGCLLECRIVGVMEGEQKQDGEKFRNDRFIAVSIKSHKHSDVHEMSDLDHNFLKELEAFFEQYHKMDGTKFKCIGQKSAKAARKMLDRQMTRRAA
jgi:inorganic pyrophosphatase